jgi:anti-anti-sigma factor
VELLVRERRIENVLVVELDGEADLATVPRLRDGLLRALRGAPGAAVVVDVDALAAIDDVALGVLVGIAGRQRATGGDVLLVCGEGRLRDTLRLTRLDRALAVYPTATAAVAAAGTGVTPT